MVGSIINPNSSRQFRVLMAVTTIVFFALLIGGVVLLLAFGDDVFLDAVEVSVWQSEDQVSRSFRVAAA